MRKPALRTILCMAVLQSGLVALAHQPRFPDPSVDVIHVENPDISQAFYEELNGKPKTFLIHSDKPFTLYINILSPKIQGARKDFSADVYGGDGILLTRLDGEKAHWTTFHEPFGGDNYNKGPEFHKQVPSGEYVVKVHNPGNLGKFVLAVGEREEFPPKEIIRTLKVLPKIKSQYFGKSPLALLFSYTGLFLIAILAVLVVIALLIYKGISRGR